MIYYRKQLFLLLFLCTFTLNHPSILLAQKQKMASLLEELASAKADTHKVNLYQEIASIYLDRHLDSVPLFGKLGLALARELKYAEGVIQHLNVLGNFFERKTQYDSAMYYYNTALEIAESNKNDKGLAVILNNIAIIETRKGNYNEAMKLYFEALEVEEKLGNEKGIAEAYNNIGVVYYYLQDIDKTLEYLEKSIEIEERLGHTELIKKGYNNIGALYDYRGKYQQALTYYQKAYTLSQTLNDKAEMSLNLNNIAVAYYKMKDFEKAEMYHQQSLALKQELGDFRGAAYSYHNFAAVNEALGNINEAEAFYLKALQIAIDKNIKEVQSKTYESLSALFSRQKQFDKAIDYLHKHIAVKDSLLSEQKTKAVAEIEAKYERKKNENEILQQRAQIAEQELSLAKKNRQIFIIVAFSLLLLFVIYTFYNQQKIKNQQLKKENALKDALSQIEIQNSLQEQRLRISRDLHDTIGAQLTVIALSINNIQHQLKSESYPILGKLDAIKDTTKTAIRELRDTIWAINKDSISLKDLCWRAQQFFSGSNEIDNMLEIDFVLDEKIDAQYSLSSIEGMNLYRIIQESVNNALKYSAAKNIDVSIKKSPTHELQISISDNGKGFDWEEIEQGNGLSNIKKRAEEIGAVLQITSTLGQGTRVELVMKYKDKP